MAIIPERKDRQPLLPIRHPNADFFVADVLDAAVKDDIGSMEHPMFSLATKPDLRIRRYEHGPVRVEVTPSVKGLATIFDKDVLIYCISQLIAGMNRGEAPSRTLIIQARDLLVATNRPTGGESYARLVETMERLSGTRVTTNIVTGGEERTAGFGMVEAWDIVKKHRDGRMVSMTVTLSDWLYNAVTAKEVLTVNRDYFRLRSPTERRIYEIARKHCGQQDEWKVSLEVLHRKLGSSDTVRKLKMKLRALAEKDHLPDYSLTLDGLMIVFRNREKWWAKEEEETLPFHYPILSTETYHDAKQFAIAVGGDVYAWEKDWHVWWDETGRPALADPDKAFIGFCRMRAKRQRQRSQGGG